MRLTLVTVPRDGKQTSKEEVNFDVSLNACVIVCVCVCMHVCKRERESMLLSTHVEKNDILWQAPSLTVSVPKSLGCRY